MNTINEINQVFEDIASSHPVLKGFYTRRLDELDADVVTTDKYPLLYAQCTGASILEGAVEYEYEVIVAQYVVEDVEDNLVSYYNDTFLLIQDVVAQFAMSAIDSPLSKNPLVTSVDLPINCQPFTARFANTLTGWSTTIDIRTPLPMKLCDVNYGA